MPATLSDVLNIISLESGSLTFLEDERFEPLVPFDTLILDYCSELSKRIMKEPESKQYADLMTFAFWIRQGSLEQLKANYLDLDKRQGRGVSFHIAPSNVPLNFAYSLIASLLAGNHSIVRVSSKEFPQTELLLRLIKQSLPKELEEYVVILKYPRNKEVNDYFSSKAQVRIVWGGDQTITELRTSPLPIRSKDIVFADRFSLLLINSDSYIASNNQEELAKGFYNDTYLFDQNACTSPRIVVWTGASVTKAKELFWNHLLKLVLKQYENFPVRAVEKFKQASLIAVHYPNTNIITMTNWLVRVEVESIDQSLIDFVGNSGFFIEYTLKQQLNELEPLMSDKFQTLSYFGEDPNQLRGELSTMKTLGVDRVVPIGRTMEFDLFWDGYDLIREMSREITTI